MLTKLRGLREERGGGAEGGINRAWLIAGIGENSGTMLAGEPT